MARPPRKNSLIPSTVRFGGGINDSDRRLDFPLELLKAALQASGYPRPVELITGMSQSRRQNELRTGGIDISILPTVGPEPSGLLSIPFPVRRGILGVRLLLARPEQAAAIGEITSLRALKKLRMGYVSEWSDLKQFQDLGFNVVSTPSYPGMFDLLRRNRVDFLSRGVSEIWLELNEPSLAQGGMVVVPKIALSQPNDDYFYIRGDDKVLAEMLLRGIKFMHQSGEYTELFVKHFGKALSDSNLKERRIIPVTGYGVRANTPLHLFDVLEVDPATARFVIPD
jgi:ABC-type amino acid transport substrate-binding protein